MAVRRMRNAPLSLYFEVVKEFSLTCIYESKRERERQKESYQACPSLKNMTEWRERERLREVRAEKLGSVHHHHHQQQQHQNLAPPSMALDCQPIVISFSYKLLDEISNPP